MSTMLIANFHSVLSLIWMSSNVYLATLTLLHEYLQTHTAIRNFKIAAMIIFFSFLCVAIIPTTILRWAHTILIPSACPTGVSISECLALNTYVPSLWQEALGSEKIPQGALSYAIIAISLVWQATMLFKPTHCRVRRFIRAPLFLLELALHYIAVLRAERNMACWWSSKSCYCLLLGLYLFVLATLDSFGSFAASLGILTVSFSWASYQLLMPRIHVYPMCVRHALNTWDFGQILPVLLLSAPFFSIAEHYLLTNTH
jgi:hypothetical protein